MMKKNEQIANNFGKNSSEAFPTFPYLFWSLNEENHCDSVINYTYEE